MYQFAAAQQTSTLDLPALFFFEISNQRARSKVSISKITGENTFNGDNFEIEGSHESSKDEKTLFCVFLQICEDCSYSQTAKEVYLCYWRIV